MRPDNVLFGQVAFVESCAGCHASHDGFDLAFFGFSDADILRRAKKHVPDSTARDIAAYIRSLGVDARGRDHRLFQPAGHVVSSDGELWTSLFGVAPNTWPANLTAAQLRAIDVRSAAVPLRLPAWSSETDDDDWLPDTELAPSVLDAEGGILRELLPAYYTTPSDASLLALVGRFRAIVRPPSGSAQALCYGETGTQPRARECFDAMRWMSSLAAVHFARRRQTEGIPIDIVRLWWETGEAAVSTNFVPAGQPQTTPRNLRTAGWLYLGYSFAPAEFREENAYLGQFLVRAGFPHLATFTALRRMVGEGRVHVPSDLQPEWDGQRFWDGALATSRAPGAIKTHVAVFVVEYLLSRLEAGDTYRASARTIIDASLDLIDQAVRSEGGGSAMAARYDERRALLRAKLAQAILPAS